MSGLFGNNGVVLFDFSNVVARALSVVQDLDKFIPLFAQMLYNYRKKFPGRHFVFAFEGTGTLERRKIYSGYKATRLHPIKEFVWARTKAKQIIKACACTAILAPKGEADDAIAIYVHTHKHSDIIIVSNDKDLWQHINNNVKIYAMVKNTNLMVDKYQCKRLLGVPPQSVVLLKALTGDKSDDIPGAVSRVRKVALLRCVLAAGTIDKLKYAIQNVELTAKEREKLLVGIETVKRNISLVSAMIHLKMYTKVFKPNLTNLHNILFNYTEKELSIIAGGVK